MGKRPIFHKMKLLFELSGENPTLPIAEIACVASVLDARPQIAVAECPKPMEALRLAMTHVVLEYLGECDPGISSFRHLLTDLALTTNKTFAGRAKLVHEGCQEKNTNSQREFERMIGTMISVPSSSSNRKRNIGPFFPETAVISGKSSSGSIAEPMTVETRENGSFSIRSYDAPDGSDACQPLALLSGNSSSRSILRYGGDTH